MSKKLGSFLTRRLPQFQMVFESQYALARGNTAPASAHRTGAEKILNRLAVILTSSAL
jgi:hypothetical protein